MHAGELVKAAGEGLSVFTIISTIAGWLPPLAALFSIAWYAVKFYDRYQRNKDRSEYEEF